MRSPRPPSTPDCASVLGPGFFDRVRRLRRAGRRGADNGDQPPWSSESGRVVLCSRADYRSTYSAVHRVMVATCSFVAFGNVARTCSRT
jgi:hypothetical protein